MEWQPIGSHAGRYEVSTSGLVRHKNGNLLTQWISNQGYMLVRLSAPRTAARVHRLVAQAFIANPLSLPYVNHIDSDRSNNKAGNLEWCTQKQNLAHMTNQGRRANFWLGKRSPNARLEDSEASDIRCLYANGGVSHSMLAEQFGISKRTIGRIINGEYYV